MKLFVNGISVAVTRNGFSEEDGTGINLPSGEARIEVRYVSSGEAPRFKIIWKPATSKNEALIPVGLIEPDYDFMKVP